MELLSSKTLSEIQLFRHMVENQCITKAKTTPTESLISNYLVFFLFFIRKLMSALSFQSWSLLPVNLNSLRKDGEVHSMLYYCQVFNTASPQKYWEGYVVFILGWHFPVWFLYHFIYHVHRRLMCFSPKQLLYMWWAEYLDPH